MDKQGTKVGRWTLYDYTEENQSYIIKDSFSDIVLFLSMQDAADMINFIDESLVEYDSRHAF